MVAILMLLVASSYNGQCAKLFFNAVRKLSGGASKYLYSTKWDSLRINERQNFMELRGIDPRTSHMLSERSTI